jgi:hypothetical protein
MTLIREPWMLRWWPVAAAAVTFVAMLVPLSAVNLAPKYVYFDDQGQAVTKIIVWTWTVIAGTGYESHGIPPIVGFGLLFAALCGIGAAITMPLTRGVARVATGFATAGVGLLVLLIGSLFASGGHPADQGVGATVLLGALGTLALAAAIPFARHRQGNDSFGIRLTGMICTCLGAAFFLIAIIVGSLNTVSLAGKFQSVRITGLTIAILGLLPLLGGGVLLAITIGRIATGPTLARIAWHLMLWPLALPLLGSCLFSINPLVRFALTISILAMAVLIMAVIEHLLCDRSRRLTSASSSPYAR